MTRRKLTAKERTARGRLASRAARRWIEPQAFQDLRLESCMTRAQAAKALDVTPRTVQNWETGGARVPWMAFRMLRILNGYALPGSAWELWTVRGAELIAPNGFSFTAPELEYLQSVFAQARLFRELYEAQGRARAAAKVVPFPDRSGSSNALHLDFNERRTA